MSYFILSIDGGGIRGILAAHILERLEQAEPFLQDVDLFAGTSTGGIIALGLASGLSPRTLVSLYEQRGPDIFSPRDVIDRVFDHADKLVRADYEETALHKALRETFGEGKTLGDLKPRRVLISSFDLSYDGTKVKQQCWKPKFLHNYDGEGNDQAVSVIDAAMRTSAAPTYFPSYQGFIDGGVVANNPAACALAKAVKEGIPLTDIRLLSIGTGYNPHFVEGDRIDWGYSQWVFRLAPLIFDGMGTVPDYQCKHLLPEGHYHRCDPSLDTVIELDDCRRIDDLLGAAADFEIDSATTWLAGRRAAPARRHASAL